jgi:syntaxin-binding protein 1
MAREQIRSFRTVHLDYHPQESHLVTFKDPWSFPTLYHPECNNLVVRHLEDIAEKVHTTPSTRGQVAKGLQL